MHLQPDPVVTRARRRAPARSQVKVRDAEGHVYALTRKAQGVDLLALHEGQRVVCTVTRRLPRVLSAEAVA
jgi:hypothetical protein